MNVQGNGVDIAVGDSTPSMMDDTDFGSVSVTAASALVAYTIQNTGTADLNLTGTPKVVVGGTNAADFTVSTVPASPVAAGGGSTTFEIEFNPSDVGLRTATISIDNNDANENPYNFSIQGTGTVPAAPEINVQGNGVSIADGDATPSTADNTDFGNVSVDGFAGFQQGEQMPWFSSLSKNEILKFDVEGFSFDLGITKTDGATTEIPGTSITYTITVTNESVGAASAFVTDTFPVAITGVTWTCSAINGATCPASGNGNMGSGNASITLPASSMVTFIATGTISPTATGTLSNTATVSSVGDTNSANDSATDADTLSAVPGRTFVIQNTGNQTLNLTGTPKVAINGTNAANFAVVAQPTSPVAASGSVSFDVTFDPSGPGLRTAEISIANDDSDENPYNFAIQGSGTAVNDAPVNTVPAPQATNEDNGLVFSLGNANRISVSDVDDADNAVSDDEPMQVTLTATGGTITLSGTAGLSFVFSDANGTGSGDGTADATMTFRGTIGTINSAMNGMTYQPSSNFNGTGSIAITTNDLGNFGTGGPLTDADNVTINVTAVNDTPVNTVPATQLVNEDTSLVFSLGNANRISVNDVDDADNAISGDEILQITLTGTNGTITLNGITGLSFTAGDGTADAAMTFSGNTTNINNAMNGMSFNPTVGFTGSATLSITTNDNGNFGVGSALSDTDNVSITVTGAGGATLVVDDLSDNGSLNGCVTGTPNDCSLRGANSVAADGDTIVFDSGLFALESGTPQVIDLLNGQITIVNDLTITGPGANLLTIKRNSISQFRIFEIDPGVTASFSGMTISNGFAPNGSMGGGGIYNDHGAVTVTGCVISGNFGAGAGISNDGNTSGTASLTIINSSISGNSANGTFGGGIFNTAHFGGNAPVTITNSTISNNIAEDGGAIMNNANGGTILMTITNSTISGNAATRFGGGFRTEGGLVLTSVTITNNRGNSDGDATGCSGGIFVQGAAPFPLLRNTIVASNFVGAIPDMVESDIDCGNPVDPSSSFNLIGTGGTGGMVDNVNNNRVGIADPMLGPLQNNGGPTHTHKPSPGYPGHDVGCAFGATTDQRGFSRTVDWPTISNGNCTGTEGSVAGTATDIGSVELLVATAAYASISGRALQPNGRGIANVVVSAYDVEGTIVRQSRTNSFGYFTLFDIQAGANYVVTATAKRYKFMQPSVVVSLDDNVDGIVFLASQ